MKEVSLLDLLKSGAHFGHSTSRWNPKMKQYIYGTRGDIHIIDLEKTRTALIKALDFLTHLTKNGGTVMIVGTKKQSRELVKKTAQDIKVPFVSLRWLGGTFTNFKTIIRTVKKLEKYELLMASEANFNQYTKKERLGIKREADKLQRLFEGLKDLRKLPDCIFVADTKHDKIAVQEAKLSGVKVVGLVDTNSDPSLIDYPIPCNDDSSKTLALVLELVAEAIEQGKRAVPAPTAPAAGVLKK